MRKVNRPFFWTSNRFIPVKNTLGWRSVICFACDITQLFGVVFFVVRSMSVFHFRLFIKETNNNYSNWTRRIRLTLKVGIKCVKATVLFFGPVTDLFQLKIRWADVPSYFLCDITQLFGIVFFVVKSMSVFHFRLFIKEKSNNYSNWPRRIHLTLKVDIKCVKPTVLFWGDQ